MRIAIILTIAVVMLMPLGLFAQSTDKTTTPLSGNMIANPPAKSSFSLLDPSRLHMTQSYTFAYSSSKYGSQSLGMYLNSLEYQIADPLKVRVDLAYLHNPGALFGNSSNALEKGQFLPGISVSWRPTNNMFFQFNYREVPLYQSNAGYYYNSSGYFPSYYHDFFENSDSGR